MTQQQQDLFNRIIQDSTSTNLEDGDYCLLVFVNGGIEFVFSSLLNFVQRFAAVMDTVDPTFTVDVQTWEFD